MTHFNLFHALHFILVLAIAQSTAPAQDFPSARATYQELNANPDHPFVVSFGTSLSQTKYCPNTCHPKSIAHHLFSIAQTNKTPEATLTFLTDPSRIWYTLQALPEFSCHSCGAMINPCKLDPTTDLKLIEQYIQACLKTQEFAHSANLNNTTHMTCPTCQNFATASKSTLPAFTPNHEQAMVQQLNALGLCNQAGCKLGLAPYRLSVEAADLVSSEDGTIDQAKLKQQAVWLEQLGNPFIFLHHYANPSCKPHLFSQLQDASWFTEFAQAFAQANPKIKHICPISQPMAFSFRTTGGTLPPFRYPITQKALFKNLVQAHVAASQGIKQVSPDATIYISHQWKVMKPQHPMWHWKYPLEALATTIANWMYNTLFVQEFKKHEDSFDAIALSLYPALYFDGFKPCGDNCSGVIDAQSALESIVSIHQAFPSKKIIIAETGCSTNDAAHHQKFIDMTLHVCKQARDMGIDVQAVYFWNHTNDPEFYREWNSKPGSTHFGFFDHLNPQDPASSINKSGQYLKEIITP